MILLNVFRDITVKLIPKLDLQISFFPGWEEHVFLKHDPPYVNVAGFDLLEGEWIWINFAWQVRAKLTLMLSVKTAQSLLWLKCHFYNLLKAVFVKWTKSLRLIALIWTEKLHEKKMVFIINVWQSGSREVSKYTLYRSVHKASHTTVHQQTRAINLSTGRMGT